MNGAHAAVPLGRPSTARASGCSPREARRGSTVVVRLDDPATCTTRSTCTTTTTARRAGRRGAPEDVRRRTRNGPNEGPPGVRALDDRSRPGQGGRGDARRPPARSSRASNERLTGRNAPVRLRARRSASEADVSAPGNVAQARPRRRARRRSTTRQAASTLEPVFVPEDGRRGRGRRLGDVLRATTRRPQRRRRRHPRRAGLHRRRPSRRSTSRSASRSASTATGSRPDCSSARASRPRRRRDAPELLAFAPLRLGLRAVTVQRVA